MSHNKASIPPGAKRCLSLKQKWDTEIFFPESTNLSREFVEEGILEDIRFMLADGGGIDEPDCREEIIYYFQSLKRHRYWWFESMRNYRRWERAALSRRKAKVHSGAAS